MLSPVVCKNNLMDVGGTAFLYIIHTYSGGLFFIVFMNIWKINNAKFTSYPIHKIIDVYDVYKAWFVINQVAFIFCIA